jgi:leucyl aminopeptidase
MKITTLLNTQAELIFVFVDDQRKPLSKISAPEIKAVIDRAVQRDFRGKLKETQMLYPEGKAAKRVLLVGAGSSSKINSQTLRTLTAHALQVAKNYQVTKAVAGLVPTVKGVSTHEASQSMLEGSILSQLNFFQFKTDRKEEDKARYETISLDLAVSDSKDLKAAQSGAEKGKTVAEGVNWGRHLIMLPGSHLNPEKLVKETQKMVAASAMKSKIKAEYWNEKDLAKHKFGGVLGVGQGSINPPRFIVLEYMNGKKSQKPMVLVGKGITFDSGGLSLKPPASQETMKYDMAGSASVLAAFKIATDLKLPVNLVALVPSAENMPSGTAIRPGDVLHMASGKTIEVLNTDAEGRLILGDALFWATTQYKPKCVVDVATLTGVCALTVGEAAAGVFCQNKKLLSALQKSSERTNDNIWPLPDFADVYQPMLRSDIADLKNTGGREAGASTASFFLKAFVHNDAPWAHLDIAGCGWYDGPRDHITGRGASGVPIRLLADFIESHANAEF